MKSSVSLFGVGMPGTYQLCVLRLSIAPMTLFGGLYPVTGLYLLDQTNGDLIPAENMPVSIRPGFIKQGKHNKFGDSEVTQAKVSGTILPAEVSSVLGASLPSVPNTENTAFNVFNDPNLSKVRIYTTFSSSSVLQPVRNYWWNKENLVSNQPGTLGTMSLKMVNGDWIFKWVLDNSSYTQTVICTVTGNLLHQRKSSDLFPNFTQGVYTSSILTKSSGQVVKGGASNSGLTLECLSAPKSLSSISKDLILTRIGDVNPAILPDLMSLFSLDKGNAPWLACYYAVESVKAISLSSLEFARDSYHWKQLMPPLKAFASLAKPKSWAQVYLWFHYGVSPTISDVSKLIDAIKSNWQYTFGDIARQFAYCHVKYGTSYDRTGKVRDDKVTYKCNARVSLRPKPQATNYLEVLFYVAKAFNVELSAANIWELIPYSFVVDWFVNTSTYMRWADYSSYPTYYSVDNILLSHKRTMDVPASRYVPGDTGNLSLTAYQREIHYSFPTEPFDLRFTDPKSHWLEGVALLVSRR